MHQGIDFFVQSRAQSLDSDRPALVILDDRLQQLPVEPVQPHAVYPFDIQRLPTTLIVDRKGIIRFVHEGWTEAEARQERRELEQLLAEP